MRALHTKLDCYGGFVIRFRQAARSFRSSLQRLRRASPGSEEINRPLLVIAKNSRPNWSGLRLKVIRRDRFRCRGCDRPGDEVTLEIHQIQPGASDVAGVLALCPNCRELANARGLSGIHIPDFLRQLWCHLHHSVPRTDPTLTLLESTVEDVLLQQCRERLLGETPYQTLRHRISD
jgi:hypothetical protein